MTILLIASRFRHFTDPCPARIRASCDARNFFSIPASSGQEREEDIMGFGRGALLWLLGVPLPIVLLLALFWHH